MTYNIFAMRIQPALNGALGSRRSIPIGNLGRALKVFSGGFPLHAPLISDAHGRVPLLGAMESVVRPASPPGGAGQEWLVHPEIGFVPQVAPAAPLEAKPLTPGFPLLTLLGVITALGAAGYVAFR